MKGLLVLVVALPLVLGCGRPNIVGEWELIDSKSGQSFGDIMTINEAGSWHRTGFPPMAGKYEWKDSNLAFTVTEVAGVDRAEAVKAGLGRVNIEDRLKQIEEQMVFTVTREEGKLVMKQVKPVSGLADLRFRKMEKN